MSEPIWDSADLDVPIGDFMRMYKLTKAEMRREGASGRIAGRGIPAGPNLYVSIVFRESAIRSWLRSELPKRIATKVTKAGGFEALQRWHDDYWTKVKLDVAGNAMILPNGERVTDIRVRPVAKH